VQIFDEWNCVWFVEESMNFLFFVALSLAANSGSGALAVDGQGQHWVPETPVGLKACTDPLVAQGVLPHTLGERVSYEIEALKISLGTVSFTVSRSGTFEGAPVTEYRSEVESVGLVNAMVQLEGKAAAIVVDAEARPVQAAARYTFQKEQRREILRFSGQGRQVRSERHDGPKRSVHEPHFNEPVYDLLTSFYLTRRLPPRAEGCVVIYAGQEAYTLWLEPEGLEVLDTPLGKRRAQRYLVRYASNRNTRVHSMKLWLDSEGEFLPLRVEGRNKWSPVARLKHYQAGKLP